MTIHRLPIEADVIVAVVGSLPELDPATALAVDAAWASEKARRPALFDGELFSVIRLTPDRIEGCFLPYRRFLAQLRQPALFEALQVKPLAVAGRLRCPQGFVIGQRSMQATQDPGAWELVPSGGIDRGALVADRVDLQRQILAELGEEVGLGPEEVRINGPYCLLVDETTHVHDIGIDMSTALSATEIEARHAALDNREYTAVAAIVDAEIDRWLAASSDRVKLVPLTQQLLTS